MMRAAIDQFRDALQRRKIIPPAEIIGDGKLRRCDAEGRNGKGDAAYLLHLDGIPAGGFENHRDGLGWENWRADMGRPLAFAEVEAHRVKVAAMQAEREADEARRRTDARERAAAIWKAALPANDSHPYLVRKGVTAHGAKLHKRALVVPVRDADGTLHSLQFIGEDGTKRYLTGGRVSGCYFSIGKAGDRICIAEGYATGATIHEATGYAVAVAFDAGNLRAVAEAIKAKRPAATLILCADDDYRTDGNPGRTKANEAARAVGGLVALPDFGADRPEGASDFNDYLAAHRGAKAIASAIANAQAPDIAQGQPATDNATVVDSGPRVELIRGGDVVPEAIVWLWKDWIARAKLHILAGPPGTGKTTLALALAATITNAGRWPDGNRARTADVVIWSGEDGIADTLLPRLLANGAERDRVHFVRDVSADGERRPFDPATDTPALALELSRLPAPPALLIVDPIVSAVAGDSHKNADTRRSLQPLVDVGERIGCAILGISHFSKGTSGRDPVERVTGSIAFGALARVVLAAVKTTKDDGTPGPRLFARAKSNNGPSGGGFHYDLEQVELTGAPGVFASHVLWGEPVEGEAHVLLATAEQPPEADSDMRSATDEAAQWLGEYLEDGPMPATGAIRAARALGYSDKVLRKARERLGVQSRKVGLREGWEWAIDRTKAPKEREDVEDAQQNRRGTFDAFGDERASSAPSNPPPDAGEVF